MGDAQHAESSDTDIIWGIHSVYEALQQRPKELSDIFVQKGKGGARLQEIIDAARKKSVRLRFVDASRLGVPRKCNHQGITARLASVPLKTLDELLESVEQAQSCRILVLDSIQDPHNLGSILRSALGAGFDRVIMTRERSAPLSGTVSSTSAGAIAHLQLCRVANLVHTLGKLKEKGFWVHGAVAPSDGQVVSIYETDFSGKVCLVIGSEGKGIRPLVQQQCDHLVSIPMSGDFDSLNASVAAAVIMFEAQRQLAHQTQ